MKRPKDGLEAQADDEEKTQAEPVYDIAELASRVTKENRPDPEDVDFGEPVGKEKL